MKCLVLLAGCGLGDGSCIEEVILTYLALDKYKWSYQPVALSMNRASVNHITEESGEPRDVLIESARLGRGSIKNLNSVNTDDFDCLIIPGGIGLLSHYQNDESIRNLIFSFSGCGKPIATMCAGIDFLKRLLGSDLLQDKLENLPANSFCCDRSANVYYTPAFRKTGDLSEVQEGIERMIQQLDSDFT